MASASTSAAYTRARGASKWRLIVVVPTSHLSFPNVVLCFTCEAEHNTARGQLCSAHAAGQSTTMREDLLPPGTPGPSAHRGEVLLEPIQQRHLARDQAQAGVLDREPGGAVDLRELLNPPGPRRPLELEGVAHRGGHVQVTARRPHGQRLRARLAQLPQWHELRRRHRRAQLL